MNKILHNKPLMFGILASAIGSGLYYNQQHKPKLANLNNALPAYGFNSNTEQAALRYVMKQAGVENIEQLLTRPTPNINEFTKNLLTFVRLGQDKLVIRSGAQERWHVKTSELLKDPHKQPAVLAALHILKLLDGVLPNFAQRDAICVLGSTFPSMNERLEFAANLYEVGALPAIWLILLAGERYATVNIDGSAEELLALSRKIGKSGPDNNDFSKLTETDFMKEAFEHSKLYKKLNTKLIDTPRGDLPRPTTETTVGDLCAWLREHPEVKTITFISCQPHVEYQKAIIAQVFKKEGMEHIKFEVAGASYEISLSDPKVADRLQYALGALGSTLWAKTPQVLEDLLGDINTIKPELKDELLALYEKQPLIYKNLHHKYKPK